MGIENHVRELPREECGKIGGATRIQKPDHNVGDMSGPSDG